MKALLLRDLRLALRSGGGFGLGLAFFFLLSVLVPLGVGPEGRKYFALHAHLDVEHSRAWNAEALAPLVTETPECARHTAEGLKRTHGVETLEEVYLKTVAGGKIALREEAART